MRFDARAAKKRGSKVFALDQLPSEEEPKE